MPAPVSRAASAAFERLMIRCAVGLRSGGAVAAGIAAFLSLAPPASPGLVAVAVAASTAWAGSYAALALRLGWSRLLVAGDVVVAGALCLGHGWLVPSAVLLDTTSWVFLVASTTVIVSQLSPRPLFGMAATVVVSGAYVGGLALHPAASPPGVAVLLLVQGTLLGALMVIVRRAVSAADLAIGQRDAAERDAAVRAARRTQEREHYRMLHDSVSATLTVVAAGGITGSSPTLRAQAGRDLDVIERIQAPSPMPPGPGWRPGAAEGSGTPAGESRAGTTRWSGDGPSSPPADGGDLRGWLIPVVTAADPAVAVESAISGVTVPVPVGAAFAGAVAEALTNVARHAGASQVQLRAGPADGGVSVELADDGTGFDPAGVPAHRRGVRESLVGRMSSVGGAAVVTSVPGSGTRIVLRWPAAGDGAPPGAGAGGGTGGDGGGGEPGPVAGTRAADGTGGGLGDVVATWYGRGFDLAVVWLVGVWHVGNDLVAVVSRSSSYRSLTAEVVAWLTLAVVGVVGGVRLLRHRTDRTGALLLAGATLAASALGTAAVPGSAIFSGADWAWGAAGWFGALVLLRRPLAELAALIAANSAVTLAVLAYDGALDRISLARFATVVYGTAALQLTLALTARALDATARRAAAVAEAESAVRRRRQVADELHAGRQDRYRAVRRSVGPLLAGLADGELDAADRRTRNRCAVEASRLRRLFAETDDVPDSLLHELRACTDIADRRGVLVDLQVLGRLPSLDRPARRALTEAPLFALADAERYARVTVVGRSDEVAISVLADGSVPVPAELAVSADPAVIVTVQDGEDRRWVEARWRG